MKVTFELANSIYTAVERVNGIALEPEECIAAVRAVRPFYAKERAEIEDALGRLLDALTTPRSDQDKEIAKATSAAMQVLQDARR